MNFRKLAMIVISACGFNASAAITVQDLRCEYQAVALGIDTTVPRFSWKMVDGAKTRGQKQTGYHILVSSTLAKVNASTGDLWDYTGSTNQSVNVEYAGTPLAAGQICYWKVQVNDKDGVMSAWSLPSRFSIGLLTQADWGGATAITFPSAGGSNWVWFRKSFTITTLPDDALMYVGSDRWNQLWINGQKVDDTYMGNTTYQDKRVLYRVYDVKSLLKTGANTIGVWGGCSDGYRFNLVPAIIGKLEMRQGSEVTSVVTDNTWKAKTSNVSQNGYNAQNYIAKWASPDLDDASWGSAQTGGLKYQNLSSDMAPPNRITDTLYPASVSNNVFDFGKLQVFTGFVELKLKNGTKGQKVTIAIKTRATGDTYNYTFDSTGTGTFLSWSNYSGVNTVTVTGLNYSLALTDCRGFRVGNDLIRGGSFDCANSLLKKEYDITQNTYRNLTVDGYSMDCLEERHGYGGDAHTHLDGSMLNYEMDGFYSKWGSDWCDAQLTSGYLPNTAPTGVDNDVGNAPLGGPAWGAFAVSMPWRVYEHYGDTRIMRKMYPVIKKWFTYLAGKTDASGLLLDSKFLNWGFFLPDWGAPQAGDATVFENLVYVWKLRETSKIAQVLGNTSESATFLTRANTVTTAFNAKYYDNASKSYRNFTTVEKALALLGGVAPADAVQSISNSIKMTCSPPNMSPAE